VLVSGSGTILDAMLDAGLEICLVASDRPCRALAVASDAGVETVLVLSGVTQRDEIARYAFQPSHVVDSIADLIDQL